MNSAQVAGAAAARLFADDRLVLSAALVAALQPVVQRVLRNLQRSRCLSLGVHFPVENAHALAEVLHPHTLGARTPAGMARRRHHPVLLLRLRRQSSAAGWQEPNQ